MGAKGAIKLTEPLGDFRESDSRIYPFKLMKGTQMADAEHNILIVSHLLGTTDYIDFKALGYKGDPIVYGGRFKRLPLGSTVADKQ